MKDDKKFSSSVPSQDMSSRLFGAVFTVGPVTANQRWRFTCYGYHGSTPQLWSVPSNHLELLVSGIYSGSLSLSALPSPVVTPAWNVTLQWNLQKPSIWAHPGSVVSSGSSVTIWCGGPIQALTYVIHKEGSTEVSHIETQVDHNNMAKFSIPSVSSLNAGRYNCYSYSSAGWTERSDTLELVVTGKRTLCVTIFAPVLKK
ncbi:Leukocyte immunoglobulin-like receptor subfamily B member 3 [Cricetulus griseus]|nr:Leukocyte immunoglobulin-like receptor subfamily B member 3 [Cricetulus griseus]